MKTWIKFIGSSALALGLAFGVTTATSQSSMDAQAAVYHKGTPKKLHGTYRTKKFSQNGWTGHEWISINNSIASLISEGGNGLGVQNGTAYRYLGNGKYRIRYHWYAGGYGYWNLKSNKSGSKIYIYKLSGQMFYKISNKVGDYR